MRIIARVHVQEGSSGRLPGDTSPELHSPTPRPGSDFWAPTDTMQTFLQTVACAACDTTLVNPHLGHLKMPCTGSKGVGVKSDT